MEPEIPSHQSNRSTNSNSPQGQLNPDGSILIPPNDNSHINDPAVNTPVPDDSDDDLRCEGLLCLDIDECLFASDQDLAWGCEIPVLEKDIGIEMCG